IAQLKCAVDYGNNFLLNGNKICENFISIWLSWTYFIIIDSEITAATGDSDFNKVKIG
ncbi:hypothetical protein WUBG_16147, partial [Wuchereria bancrofti]